MQNYIKIWVEVYKPHPVFLDISEIKKFSKNKELHTQFFDEFI